MSKQKLVKKTLQPFRCFTQSVPPPHYGVGSALHPLSPAVHASASRTANLSLCSNLRAARPRAKGKSILTGLRCRQEFLVFFASTLRLRYFYNQPKGSNRSILGLSAAAGPRGEWALHTNVK